MGNGKTEEWEWKNEDLRMECKWENGKRAYRLCKPTILGASWHVEGFDLRWESTQENGLGTKQSTEYITSSKACMDETR